MPRKPGKHGQAANIKRQHGTSMRRREVTRIAGFRSVQVRQQQQHRERQMIAQQGDPDIAVGQQKVSCFLLKYQAQPAIQLALQALLICMPNHLKVIRPVPKPNQCQNLMRQVPMHQPSLRVILIYHQLMLGIMRLVIIHKSSLRITEDSQCQNLIYSCISQIVMMRWQRLIFIMQTQTMT